MKLSIIFSSKHLNLSVLNYVQNYLYLIPLALGSWIGTFIIVKKELHKTNKVLEK
jgi:hypothetical protein